MKTAAVVYDSETFLNSGNIVGSLKNILIKRNYQVLVYDTSLEEKSNVYNALENEAPDLLITFDMEGFEQETQTGNLFYNLLTSKMLHFIFKDKEKYKEYLSGKLSLAMFFFSVGNSEAELYEMKKKYENIPYLERVAYLKTEDMEEAIITLENETGWK